MQANYRIHESRIGELRERIAILNKVAAKLEVPAVVMIVGEQIIRRKYAVNAANFKWFWPEDEVPCGLSDTGQVSVWHHVEISGEAPKYAGWSLIGVLEPIPLDDGSVENEVRAVPGNSVPVEYRHRCGDCDQCGKNRRRNETFVVRHEDGSHKVVGRNCLKDFLGHKDPHALAGFAELMIQLGDDIESGIFGDDLEGLGGGNNQPWSYDAEHFLAWANSVIRRDGWVSRTAAKEDFIGRKRASADAVLNLLIPPKPMNRDWQESREAYKPEEKDFAAAAAAIEWARHLADDGSELSDYYHNLRLIARAGFVRWKSVGLAASIIVAHAKVIEKDVHQNRPVISQHVGQIGERIQLAVCVEKIISNEGFYGVIGIHKMRDDAGNDLVWFASGSAEWLDVGERIEVVATIKEHGDYNGRKQTIVSRVKKYVPKPPKEKKAKKSKKAEQC